MCDDCWTSLRLAPRLLDQLRADHGVDWACAVDRYEGRMKEVIHALKYERRRSIAPPLGELMRDDAARGSCSDADVVVPVPLHPRREYQRGFNQADDLARHLGVPVVPLLKRVVFTQSQIELPKEERHRNVKDAFAFAPDPRSLIPDPGIVVLVDDVSTTGATLDACARVLKSCGREGSAGAYSSPSRERTALITSAETASLSRSPSRRIQSGCCACRR